jgi:hypothetical protein
LKLATTGHPLVGLRFAFDRMGDPSATDEERQLRKRRLMKGPKEFRDIRSNARSKR